MKKIIIIIYILYSVNVSSQNFKNISPLNNNYIGYISNIKLYNKNTLFCSFYDQSQSAYGTNVLLHSSNAGQSWERIIEKPIGNLTFINIDTSFGTYIFFDKSTSGYQPYFLSTYNGWKSYDSTTFGSPGFYGPFVGNRKIYYSWNATYRSTDFAKSWNKVSDLTIYDMQFVNDTLGYGFSFDIDDNYSLVKTTDNGKTWKKVDGYTWTITYPQFLSGAFYGANEKEGEFKKSKDEGKTWVNIHKNLPSNFSIFSREGFKNWHFINAQTGFAFDVKNGNGLYKTTNGGQSWEQLWNGAFSYIKDMQCLYDNKRVYISLASYNGGPPSAYYGVFDSTDIWSSVPRQIDISNQFKVYPNPTNENLTISYSGFVKLGTVGYLYDVSGKEAAQFTINGASTNISLKGLEKGVYVLKVITENGEFVEKVIKE